MYIIRTYYEVKCKNQQPHKKISAESFININQSTENKFEIWREPGKALW